MARTQTSITPSLNSIRATLADCERFLASPGYPLGDVLRKATEKRIAALRKAIARREKHGF